MGKPQPKRPKDMSPLERAIYARQRGIETMRKSIERIRAQADADVKAIEKRIMEKAVLLDALRKGALNG